MFYNQKSTFAPAITLTIHFINTSPQSTKKICTCTCCKSILHDSPPAHSTSQHTHSWCQSVNTRAGYIQLASLLAVFPQKNTLSVLVLSNYFLSKYRCADCSHTKDFINQIVHYATHQSSVAQTCPRVTILRTATTSKIQSCSSGHNYQ